MHSFSLVGYNVLFFRLSTIIWWLALFSCQLDFWWNILDGLNITSMSWSCGIREM